jgi:hypothetical protein
MEPQNCWEYWDCQKEIKDNCPAYVTDFGRECFNIAADYCLRVMKELNNCWDCPFFENLIGKEGIYK